jgi:hypothetical protein
MLGFIRRAVVVNDEILEADGLHHVGGRASIKGINDVPFLTNSSMMEVDFEHRHCRREVCQLEFAQMYRLRERGDDYRDGTPLIGREDEIFPQQCGNLEQTGYGFC